MTRFSLSPVARRFRRLIVPLLAVGLILAAVGVAQPAAAQFRDVGYTFEPTVQGIFDSENASLQNEPLYGGTLGLSFGRYFRVNAEYLANAGASTSFTNVDRLSGLLDRQLDVRRYGARLRLNLLDRRVIPYLTAGTGVLQLDPKAVDATRTIYGLAGGGFAFRLQDWVRVSLSGEVLSYRYDPVATYLGPSAPNNFRTGTELVRTPALTASVSLFLGGRSLDEQTAVDAALQDQFGGGGLFANTRLFVNPIYGRIEFNDALGFPTDQNVTGVHAGVDLGPYVGLRGFYWRGVGGESAIDVSGFEDIQMYGSELQLRLNLGLGRGFVPYARVGGGYLDVQDGYADDLPDGALLPDDRFFGITGAGLEVPVTRSLKLSGGVRGLIMSNPNVEQAGDPGDLYGSAMYSAGVEFRLGGGRDEPDPEPEPLPGPSPVGDASEAPPADTDEADADVADDVQGVDSSDDLTPVERQLLARVDSLERVLQGERADTTQARAPRRRSNVSDRTVTVPVPEEGEIYVRFGGDAQPARTGTTATASGSEDAEGELTSGQLEQRVVKALRRQLRADSAQALQADNIERLVDRALRDALQRQQQRTAPQQGGQAQQIQQLQNQIEQLRRDLQAQRQAQRSAETTTAPEPTTAEPTSSQPFYREVLGRPLTYLVPVTGYRGGDGLSQFQIGVRGDYRASTSSRFHLMPELTFGVGGGEGISPNLLGNVAYSFLRDSVPALTGVPLQPYVGAGVGIASTGGFTFEPVLNTMLGVDYRVLGRQAAFLEYSTLDLGDIHRIHLGYRIRF